MTPICLHIDRVSGVVCSKELCRLAQSVASSGGAQYVVEQLVATACVIVMGFSGG